MTIDRRAVQIGLVMLFAAVGPRARADTTQTFDRDGYQLTVIDKDSGISQQLQRRMIEAFFTVYPQMVIDFNVAAPRHVTFIFDPDFTNSAAAALIDRVTFNAGYMIGHPRDIDVVTHEVMHVVQAYRSRTIPSWLIEGIADYARNRYGVDNHDWSLTPYRDGQSYTDSYRITGRFLTWLEQRYPGMVQRLDDALRGDGYTPDLWVTLYDAPLDDLWENYAADPEL